MAKRLSLTKRQLETDVGRELLALLVGIADDGKISKGEIVALRTWLRRHTDTDIAGAEFLRELVERIVADGVVTKDELVELHEGIEKVMPVDARRDAQTARREAKAEADAKRAAAEPKGPTSKCPTCGADLGRLVKTGGVCKECGARYHVSDGQLLSPGDYTKKLTREAEARAGGRLDAPSENQLALLVCLSAPLRRGMTAAEASKILDGYDTDDPTEDEVADYVRVANKIRDRVRAGEHIDDIIANPPASSRASGSGCLGVALIAAGAGCAWWMVA